MPEGHGVVCIFGASRFAHQYITNMSGMIWTVVFSLYDPRDSSYRKKILACS